MNGMVRVRLRLSAHSEMGSYKGALDTSVIHTRVGVDDVTDATFGTIEFFGPPLFLTFAPQSPLMLP